MSKYRSTLHTDNLDFDVNLDKTFTERIDLDETRVDCAIKPTKLRDQTDITLRDRLIWIGADDTARDRSHGTDTVSKSVDYTAISLGSLTRRPLRGDLLMLPYQP
jgi:hypothetical protein